MKVWDEYINFFTEEKLKSLYLEHVILSSATGIDNMSHKLLWPMLNDQLQIINRKVATGDYNFTKYKLKLISKGRSKSPREISIPTIRDKITLRALCEFLGEKFSDDLNFILPQVFIKKIKKEMDENKYENFIKLDVKNFYPK
ncbi:hypothetical protein [Sodalis sp. dw_96]|uniref:hypothetical protein n=1 Tax=Sodalis sp. dw_96 TaxID=2719794 RepID=UPI001BD3E475|nr:hypothetical protein [Sodalis sp. dw_96]